MKRLPATVVLALSVASCARRSAPDGSSSNDPTEDGVASDTVGDAATAGSTDAGATADATSLEVKPLQPPPTLPFISNQQFADCVHPGVREDCNNGWCRIPAGCYVYGSPEDEIGRARYDERQTRVTLTRDFEIQQTEVTQAAWLETGWSVPPVPEDVSISHCEAPECPVNRTTWYWALRYANWLSERNGLPSCFELSNCQEPSTEWEKAHDFTCDVALNAPSIYECEGYRLPTSAEWEYAARAGTTTPYYSGHIKTDFPSIKDCNLDPNLARIAWYCANVPNAGTPARSEQPVGLLEPNAWGLFDTLGNAPEWVMDTYGGVSWIDPYVDPEAQLESVVHGTSRNCPFFSTATGCRVSIKLPAHRAERWAGFRLARTLGPGTLPTLADIPETAPAR